MKACTSVPIYSYILVVLKTTLNFPYDEHFPVVKRYEEYHTVQIKSADSNISMYRLKHACFLMTKVKILDDHKLLDKPLSLLDKNLPVQSSAIKINN